MNIRIWLVTWERETWISASEVLAIAAILYFGPSAAIRLLVGLPLLAHIGYKAVTSLPMGAVPGRPPGGRQRSQYDLRARVKAFLTEVRRVEDFAARARVAGWSGREVKNEVLEGQKRIIEAAAQVARATGQPQTREIREREPARAATQSA